MRLLEDPQFLNTAAGVCYCVAAVFAVLAIILFFVFDIRGMIRAYREIKEIRRTKDSRLRPSHSSCCPAVIPYGYARLSLLKGISYLFLLSRNRNRDRYDRALSLPALYLQGSITHSLDPLPHVTNTDV